MNDWFPIDMQPGELVTMQPTDALHDRQHYIDDDRYWSQPKDDGNKLVVFACENGDVFFQTRAKRLIDAPSFAVYLAFATVAKEHGSFIVEGEIFYLDANGKQHMTAVTAQASNEKAGWHKVDPVMKIRLFGCLWNQFYGMRELKGVQVHGAVKLTELLIAENCEHFQRMNVAYTREQKQALASAQQANGREGEVYFLSDLQHRPGKITSSRDPQYDGYVRCKYYLGIQRYLVTAVAPSRAEGHAIGGFSVRDTDGNDVGNVGTGYSREQQVELLRRFTENPTAHGSWWMHRPRPCMESCAMPLSKAFAIENCTGTIENNLVA